MLKKIVCVKKDDLNKLEVGKTYTAYEVPFWGEAYWDLKEVKGYRFLKDLFKEVV